ncbi:MAG: IS481 family transposase [Candidatus Paceibacterota bacterium]|jgi:transposase
MSKTIKEERLRWVLPIVAKEIKLKDAAKVCPYGKRSLERWAAAFKEQGEIGLEPKSTKPHTNPKETSIRVKERIIEIRKTTSKCALKIKWQMEREGLKINARTIGKILKAEGLTRKYRIKRVKYKYIRAERKPGELVEIDIKYVPGRIQGKRYYQYTAIDTASRWRFLKIYEEQSNYHSIIFLEEVIKLFPHKIEAVKTDNGFVFTNLYTGTYKRADLMPKRPHGFDVFCNQSNIIHYLIDPGKPAQNGAVERSHRSDQEQFYDQNNFKNIRDLEKKIKLWNIYYNDLEHCGLNGKSPNEFLADYKLINPPNVCA